MTTPPPTNSADAGNVLRLGVIGLSEGNGHPYSWSAICNGYDAAAMATCPFPVIPEYLAKQTFPRDAIANARVTHVWTQERAVTEHVARAALIPHLVDRYEDLVGRVDAVLLARDDAENHVVMSVPFLDAGMPIYIDKPIALTRASLGSLYEHQRFPGQVFSCSALRFSDDMALSADAKAELGDIRHVQATVPKSWEKYGVHLVDPVLQMLGMYGKECAVRSTCIRDVTVVTADWGAVSASFTCLGAAAGAIKIAVFGTRGCKELVFTDTFAAFKRGLERFVEGVRTKREMTTRTELESVVSIIERGMAA